MYSSDQLTSELSGPEPYWPLLPRVQSPTSKVVTVLDEDGIVRYQSAPVKWLLGYEPQELVRRDIEHIVHPDSQDVLRGELGRMRRGTEKFAQWKLQFRRASRNTCWLEGLASNFLRDPRLGGILIYWRELNA